MSNNNKTQETKTSKPAITDKLAKLIDEIGQLSVLELADLVKALEKKFGVSGATLVAAPSPKTASAAAGEAAPKEEKTEFTIVLADSGPKKIAVIKAVRELKPDLGLKDAKDLVESAPKELLTNVKKELAEQAKKKLEEAGAKVELK